MACSGNERLDKATFVTRVSAGYNDAFPLRAAIQAIPGLGSSLDTMLAGLGARWQYERLERFVALLQDRLAALEACRGELQITPCEELYDLALEVFDRVRRTRSERRREWFANMLSGHVLEPHDWDDAQIAADLLDQLTELHVRVLQTAVAAPECTEPFEGLRVVGFRAGEHVWIPGKGSIVPPLVLTEAFPRTAMPVLQFVCADLTARGLLRDEGVGRLDTGAMEYFTATEFGRKFIDSIRNPVDTAKTA